MVVQGLSKRGMDLTYLGNGSSVLAVAGQCSQGGNIAIWDTQRPLTSGPIARLSYHLAAVTALKVTLTLTMAHSPLCQSYNCLLMCVFERDLDSFCGKAHAIKSCLNGIFHAEACWLASIAYNCIEPNHQQLYA